jgi:hypothetical protein
MVQSAEESRGEDRRHHRVGRTGGKTRVREEERIRKGA